MSKKRQHSDTPFENNQENHVKNRSGNIEVICEHNAETPFCVHGPCLLFERYKRGGEIEQFFACSVCRSRKDCNFYHPLKEAIDPKKQETSKKLMLANYHPPHAELFQRLKKIRELEPQQRSYCVTCNKLLLSKERAKEHKSHSIFSGLQNKQLKQPSKFIPPLSNKHAEAQFWLTPSCIGFLANCISDMNKFDSVLCIGMPRLFEVLNLKPFKTTIKSFLLDLDYRHAQFWSPLKFAPYNMMSGYFYTALGQKALEKFVSTSSNLLIVIDPPYGALVDPIAHNLKRICSQSKLSEKSLVENDVKIMWIFPYFMESRLQQAMPGLKLCDYQLTYENHPKFSGKKPSAGTPIRMFTDIDLKEIKLPESQGYK